MLPAAPQHVRPRAPEHTDGVRMIATTLAGSAIDAFGPGMPVARAVGEHAHVRSQALVAGQRKVALLRLPDWIVTGAWPASAASASRVG